MARDDAVADVGARVAPRLFKDAEEEDEAVAEARRAPRARMTARRSAGAHGRSRRRGTAETRVLNSYKVTGFER